MRRIALFAFTALLLSLAVARGAPAPPKTDPLKTGVIHESESGKHQHAFAYYVHAKYDRRRWSPLVISSHGKGGTGKGEIGQWRPLADKYGFIVACPDMITASGEDSRRKSELPPGVEDDEVILSIVEEMKQKFFVNGHAVMMTGFSGGGMPTYRTGLGHPELFTAACSRAGNYYPGVLVEKEDVLAKAREMPIYIFWGDKDQAGGGLIPDQAPKAYAKLKELGFANIKYEILPGVGHASKTDLAAAWFDETVVKPTAEKYARSMPVAYGLWEAGGLARREKFGDAIKLLKKLVGTERKLKLTEEEGAGVAAAKLEDIEIAAQALLDEAKELQAAKDEFLGYEKASYVAARYKYSRVEKEARKLASELKRTEGYKAGELFAKAEEYAGRKKCKLAYKKLGVIIDDYPDTAAAERARVLREELENDPDIREKL